MNWFRKQLDTTDLGLFSVLAWIVMLFLFGFVLLACTLLEIKYDLKLLAIEFITCALLAIIWLSHKLPQTAKKHNKYAIYIISLVIVHGLSFAIGRDNSDMYYLTMFALGLLVYPAFVIYAILYHGLHKVIPISAVVSIGIAVLEIWICWNHVKIE